MDYLSSSLSRTELQFGEYLVIVVHIFCLREQFTCKITYSHTNVIDARPAFEDGLAHSWSRNEKKQKSLFYVTSWPFDFLQKFFVNRSRYVVVLQILSSIVVVIAACCFAYAKLNKPWLMLCQVE